MTFTYFVSLMVGQGLSLRSKVTISNLLDDCLLYTSRCV